MRLLREWSKGGLRRLGEALSWRPARQNRKKEELHASLNKSCPEGQTVRDPLLQAFRGAGDLRVQDPLWVLGFTQERIQKQASTA